MQKVPDHTVLRHGALSACRHTVSGSLSFPFRGSFHLSLTVLVHYRSMGSIQAWRKVPPDSRRIARVLRYSGTHYALSRFAYRAVTVSGLPFQAVRLAFEVRHRGPYNPRRIATSGLAFSPFARRY